MITTFSLSTTSYFESFSYPAGEIQTRLTEEGLNLVQAADEVRLIAHIRNAEDVIRVAQLGDALVGAKTSAPRILVLPYLPYGRADRRFVPGDCQALEIFGDILRAGAWDAVATLDAHSRAAADSIPNLLNVSPLPLIRRACLHACGHKYANLVLLFPDKGATERYDLSSLPFPVLHCEKKRDAATGKLLGFKVPKQSEFPASKVLIVDDICDGGGTFNGIAGELKDYGLELYLYVTHGIFSKGFEELSKRFVSIYASDSFPCQIGERQCVRFDSYPVIWQALKPPAAITEGAPSEVKR